MTAIDRTGGLTGGERVGRRLPGAPGAGVRRTGLPRTLSGWLTTTDHKAIGVAYAVTSLVFLAIGGALAGIIRAELAQPGLQVVDEATYNSIFTIHGSVMVYLFAVPFGFALANYLVPLQIGAPDLAFPRLNALSYWLYLFGGIIMLLGFVTDGGAAGFGWFAYPPLSGPTGSPGLGADLWIVAIILTGTSGTLGAVNVITTISMMRAPGMTMFRMPILTWNLFLTSFMVLVAFPVLTGALIMLRGRPAVRHPLLRPDGRRVADAVPAPVLVLRPPRGVHRRPAVLRRGHRDLPGVLAQAGVRVQGPRPRHARDLGAVDVGVGPPHVRHRPGRAAVLRRHVVPHRRADRRQGVQLDRHDVGRLAHASSRRCCSPSASSSRS